MGNAPASVRPPERPVAASALPGGFEAQRLACAMLEPLRETPEVAGAFIAK
jgi:hypothetical protein